MVNFHRLIKWMHRFRLSLLASMENLFVDVGGCFLFEIYFRKLSLSTNMIEKIANLNGLSKMRILREDFLC